jgi:hypothetical protein
LVLVAVVEVVVIEVAAVEVALVLLLQGYTSLMASLTCLSVIDVKDLLQT